MGVDPSRAPNWRSMPVRFVTLESFEFRKNSNLIMQMAEGVSFIVVLLNHMLSCISDCSFKSINDTLAFNMSIVDLGVFTFAFVFIVLKR